MLETIVVFIVHATKFVSIILRNAILIFDELIRAPWIVAVDKLLYKGSTNPLLNFNI